ncbi:nuclear transport factor 2 family protein [Natronococcus sp.]|uniref:nuclear transport factor 2 family protein n=1 Tax=Natronococcus sp. TaxID=35747 RepID=UPI003A4D2E99
MTTTESVLEHHLTAFGDQELSAIMDDYREESVVVTNVGTFRGLEEIEGLFADLCEEFDQEGATIDVHQQTVEDEFAYIVWEGKTPDNVYEFATDTFYVPDDTIDFQTFAGDVTPTE